MPPVSVETFLTNLAKSNLLAPDQAAELRRDLPRDSTASAAEKPTTASRPPSPDASPAPPPWFANKPDSPVQAAQIADRLVVRGWLTRWQADMLLAGRKAFFLGRYKLLDRIGGGGMGAVFKAQHTTMGRIVALKLMSSELMKDRVARARFNQEIQAAAALDHRHIVTAYDADCVADVHFLVMEYVEGQDLGAVILRGETLSIGWACEIIYQAALGLQHAHERGMVHRDIKPTNLLVTSDPETGLPLVKLLDLGLARFVSETRDDEGGLTRPGQVLGTPDYMAPEQAADTRRADIRSDIFSLGCTLFRLLTGQLPYKGENVLEKIVARATTDAPPIRSLRRDIPPQLEAVIARMLQRDPGGRYQTPGEVATALAPFADHAASQGAHLHHAALSAAPTGPALGQRPPANGANSASPELERFFQFLATEAADPHPSPAAKSANSKSGPAPSAFPLGRDAAGRRSPPLPRRSWLRRKCAHARTLLRLGWGRLHLEPRTVSAAALLLLTGGGLWLWNATGVAVLEIEWPAEDRGGATLHIDGRPALLTTTGPLVFSGPPGPRRVHFERPGFDAIDVVLNFQRSERKPFSPQWRRSALAIQHPRLGDLARRVAAGGDADVDSPAAIALRDELIDLVRQSATTPLALDAARLLPRVRWPVDHLSRENISEYELKTAEANSTGAAAGQIVGILGDSRLKHWNQVRSVAASADGSLFASAGLDGVVKIWEAATGDELRTFAVRSGPARVVFSPRGTALAAAAPRGGVTLLDARQGVVLAQLAGARPPVAFSHDARFLAALDVQGRVLVFRVADGDVYRTLVRKSSRSPASPGDRVEETLEFSHDDRLLAVGDRGPAHGVQVWDIETGMRRFSHPHALRPRFSPNDALLAAGVGDRGQLALWHTIDGKPARLLDEAGTPLAFLAAGNTLASMRNERVILWNLETGEEQGTLVDVAGIAAVSPDGTCLAAADQTFGWLKFWNLPQGGPRTAAGHARGIEALAFSPDSQTLATGGDDHRLKLWHPASATERLLAGSAAGPADLGPDGRILALATEGGGVKLWDLASRTASRTLDARARRILAVAFSPNGRYIAAIGDWGFFTTTLRLWDSSSGRELTLLGDHPGNTHALTFSPDSRSLAAAGDRRTVVIWDLETLQPRHTLEDQPDRITALEFNPRGTTLAVACRNHPVKLLDISQAEPQAGGGPPTIATALAYCPVRDCLALGTTDGRVEIWNAAGIECQATLAGAKAAVNSLSFSTDGAHLAAATSSGKIILWQISHGSQHAAPEQTLAIGPSGGIVHQARFTPEGRHLVTVNGNGTIYILRLAEFAPRRPPHPPTAATPAPEN